MLNAYFSINSNDANIHSWYRAQKRKTQQINEFRFLHVTTGNNIPIRVERHAKSRTDRLALKKLQNEWLKTDLQSAKSK